MVNFLPRRHIAWMRIVRWLCAVALLALLYRAVDWRLVSRALWQLDAVTLGCALALFVPQTLVSAWRWQMLMAPVCKLTYGTALRQVLLSSAWNLIVPSKLGDLTKGFMNHGRSSGARSLGIARAVAEKLGDLAALFGWMMAALLGWLGLAAWCCLALVLLTRRRTEYDDAAQRTAAAPATHWPLVAGLTIGLWGLHLGQIGLFLSAAGVAVDLPTALARVPMAIFAGLAPLTPWGLGTRDAALIWLFHDVASAPQMAAVGLLTASRYLVPALPGIALLAFAPRRPVEQPSEYQVVQYVVSPASSRAAVDAVGASIR